MADLNRLRASLEKARAITFPEHPDSEELDDLMMVLDQMDGHIVGIGEAVLGGGRPPQAIAGLDELESAFDSVQVESTRDAEIMQQCRQILAYLFEIDEAVRGK